MTPVAFKRLDVRKLIVAGIEPFPEIRKRQLPRFRSNPSPAVTIERVRAFNRAIEQEAKDVDAPVVNLFAQPVREDLVFDLDGFHPNDAGHREIARLFLEAIRLKLGLR